MMVGVHQEHEGVHPGPVPARHHAGRAQAAHQPAPPHRRLSGRCRLIIRILRRAGIWPQFVNKRHYNDEIFSYYYCTRIVSISL